ncbi:MAG TPA: hypothetical protein VEJ37_11395, partial [Xanthobacteraceae bacterium]|nr:hypothetical protein [Xanthobacteraceae bacterium]
SGAVLTVSGGFVAAGALVDLLSGGSAIVSGTLGNGGTLFASGPGSELEITDGAFVKSAVIEIADGEVALQAGGSTTAEIAFTSTGSGGLILDGTGSATYSGLRISGFGGVSGSASEQFIDFTQVISGAGVSAVYVSAVSHTSGTLEVVNGATLLAEVTLIGKYVTSDFHVGSGIGGSVAVNDPASGIAGATVTTLASTADGAPATGTAASVALLGNYMAALFAMPEGQIGAQPATAETAQSQAALTHPHTG